MPSIFQALPMGHKLRESLMGGLEQQPFGKCTHFISHAWTLNFKDLVAVVCDPRNLGLKVPYFDAPPHALYATATPFQMLFFFLMPFQYFFFSLSTAQPRAEGAAARSRPLFDAPLLFRLFKPV